MSGRRALWVAVAAAAAATVAVFWFPRASEPNEEFVQSASVHSYSVGVDGRALTLGVISEPSCTRIPHVVSVSESERAVSVIVKQGGCSRLASAGEELVLLEVRLAAPLGGRAVVNDGTIVPLSVIDPGTAEPAP